MNIDSIKHALPEDCYFKEKVAKSMIVLHFTAGTTASGAANFWKTQKNKVSAPYLVDRDGSIYECYNPEYWSYHLGIKGTHAHDKRSIAIEIVNPGPLMPMNEDLCFWPGLFTAKYCKRTETDKYIKLDVDAYRGYRYYATFTPDQLQSVKALTESLAYRFKIPMDIIPRPQDFQIETASKWNGITTHTCFRSDKFDVGPAFDWSIFDKKVVS